MAWQPPAWLVDGFLHRQSAAFLSAPAKSGKSLLAVRLAAAVSSGTAFFGRATRQGDVIYLAGERASWLPSRLGALQQEGIAFDPGRLRIFPAPVIFSDPAEVEVFVALIGHPALVIIDTLRTCFQGDENSSADMQRWVRGIERLKHQTGAAVLVIHHDHRQRRTQHGSQLPTDFSGSGVLLASMDAYFHLESTTIGITLKTVAANEGNNLEVALRIRTVQLDDSKTALIEEVASPHAASSDRGPAISSLLDGIIAVLGDFGQLSQAALTQHVRERYPERWPKLQSASVGKVLKQHAHLFLVRRDPTHEQRKLIRLIGDAQTLSEQLFL